MGFCCLDIYNFFQQHDSCSRNYPELAEVIAKLARRAVECMKENSSNYEDDVWQEVDAMLDLLLEALGGLVIDMVGSLTSSHQAPLYRMTAFRSISALVLLPLDQQLVSLEGTS